MPYVQVRTSVSLTEKQITAMKDELSPAIALIPGKVEEGLMIEFVPDCQLYFAGSNAQPAAYVTVLTNNEIEEPLLRPYSEKLFTVISQVTEIPKQRIYIVHQDLPKWHSGRKWYS